MLTALRKIYYILSTNMTSLCLIASGFVLVSILEALGIGIIGPFVYLANNPNEVLEKPLTSLIYRQLNFSSPHVFVAALGFFIILFYFAKSIINWRIQSAIFRFSYDQESKLVKKLLHGYFSAPYTYHLSQDSSTIVHTITGDVKKLSMGVLIPLLTVVANISVISFLSLLLFLSNPWITLITLFSLLPVFILLNFYKEKLKQWGKEVSKANEAKSRLIYQALGGIKEVQVIGCSNYFEQEVSSHSAKYVKASAENFSFKVAPRMIMESFFISIIIGFTSFILYFDGNAESIISTLGIFALASIRLIPASGNLANSLAVLRNSSYVVNKLYLNLKELENAIRTPRFELSNQLQSQSVNDGSPLQTIFSSSHLVNPKSKNLDFEKSVLINNIGYRYPGMNCQALQDITIEVIKGESIAFIGKSGAGKTTLIDVLLGLLIPSCGDIKVDGISIYQNLRGWQNLIGYIPQTIHLVDATVASNIAFGVPANQIDHEKLFQCIRAAQLESVISSLPNGIDTTVGERGVRLSGGQRQRIGIARALYHGSEILIMDEATSALDNETESLVTEAIRELSGRKTIFVVAHRLSTIEYCDRVYMLEGGRIVKSGSFNEVVQH